MRDVGTKNDNVGDTYSADFFNSLRNEVENPVTDTGQTLDAEVGPDTDLNMMGKAMAVYGAGADFFQDSGAADAYVLARSGGLQAWPEYRNGVSAVFKVGNTNTGASTVNVSTLGVKDITNPDGTALVAGILIAGTYISMRYVLSNDRFELVASSTNPFASTGQTITTAGLLTLPHGLGVEPKLIQYVIQCTTAEHGYSIGDRVMIDFNSSTDTNERFSNPTIDATNITIRFSADPIVFEFQNANTGLKAGATNTSWQLYVRAFA